MPVAGFELKAVEEFFKDGLHGRLAPVGDVAILNTAVTEIPDRPRSEETSGRHQERLKFLRPFEVDTNVAKLERICEELAKLDAAKEARQPMPPRTAS